LRGPGEDVPDDQHRQLVEIQEEELSDTQPEPYEAPSVEEIDTGGAPISTAAGTTLQIPG
jgi:hypothetical protein